MPLSGVDPRRLGDYKLYPLPEPTSIAPLQSKQVQFIYRAGVPLQSSMQLPVLPPMRRKVPARCRLRLSIVSTTTREKGLGVPLPAGFVGRAGAGPTGEPVFLGSGSAGDNAIRLPIDIETGLAMDVDVAYDIAEEKQVKNHHRRRRVTAPSRSLMRNPLR